MVSADASSSFLPAPKSLPAPQLRAATTSVVAAPHRIRQITEALMQEGARGLLVEPRGGRLPIFAAGRVGDAELPYRWGLPRSPRTGQLTLRLGGGVFGYHLEITRWRYEDGLLSTDEPVVLHALKSRASRRAEARGVKGAVLSTDGRLLGAAQVRNIAEKGMLLQLSEPGAVRCGDLVDLDIHAPGASPFRVGGLIVHLGEELAGVQIITGTPEAHRAWEGLVDAALHPHTRRGQTWAEATWNLYERSGYFELSRKCPASFAPLRSAFSVASRRLDLAPELGAQVTWPSARGVEASVSMLRVYSGTSLLYQVARRRDGESPGPARQMLRAINLRALEPLVASPEHRWLLVFVQQDGARWSRLAYRDFALQLPEEAGACVLPFRACELTSAPAERPRAGTRISAPAPEELPWLVEQIQRLRGQPYCECLDLCAEGFALSELSSRWRRSGFRRTRQVLIARRGRAAAAAVMETADQGLHLFGLLDCLRLYPLGPGGAALFGELTAAARQHFQAEGRERFVLLAEGEQARAGAPAGARDLGVADLIALPAAVVPDLMEHLSLVTAHRSDATGPHPDHVSSHNEVRHG